MLPEDFMASFILLSVINFVLSPGGNQGNENTCIIQNTKVKPDIRKEMQELLSLVSTKWIYFVIIFVHLFLGEKEVHSSVFSQGGGEGWGGRGNCLLHFVHWGHGYFNLLPVSDTLQPMDCLVHGILQARILEWVAFSLLQGIFPTQGSNPDLPHCRRILYQLSHKGSSRILERVAYPFSSGSFRSRNRTGVSCIAGRFLATEL